jgi:hypothetical protein
VTHPERSSVNLQEHDPATSFLLPTFHFLASRLTTSIAAFSASSVN